MLKLNYWADIRDRNKVPHCVVRTSIMVQYMMKHNEVVTGKVKQA